MKKKSDLEFHTPQREWRQAVAQDYSNTKEQNIRLWDIMYLLIHHCRIQRIMKMNGVTRKKRRKKKHRLKIRIHPKEPTRPSLRCRILSLRGTVVLECGKMLQKGGYKKKLNTINFRQSMHYNLFRYIRNENDILKLVSCIMENTKSEDAKGEDEFWSKAEALYYQALIAYIWYEAPEEENNMNTLLEMLNASEVREEDETFKNAEDMMFRRLEKKDPGHFSARQYKKFRLAAG